MWDLIIAFLGGVGGGMLCHAGLARKVYNLQCDVSTLQERLLQEKNQRASLSRRTVKAELEDLKELQSIPQPAKQVNSLKKFGIGA